MPLWVHCPQCDQHYQFPEASAGKQVGCPKCHRVLTVSAPAAQPAPMPIPPAPRLPQPVPLQEEPLWAMPVAQGRQPTRPRPIDDRRPRPASPRRPPSPETLDPNLPATAGDNPTAYHHPACGGSTTFSPDIAARLSGDPFGFVPAAYCADLPALTSACARWSGTGRAKPSPRIGAVFADKCTPERFSCASSAVL